MHEAQIQLHRDLLSRILGVARHLSATADLNDILQVVIDAMRDTLNADRATVFEYDAATNELFTNVAHGVAARTSQPAATEGDAQAVREIRFPASAGLAGECAQARRIINVPHAYADRRFNQAIDKQTGYRTRSILTIPLLGHDGELVGVAQVLNKRGDEAFTEHDEEIGLALAAQAAVAMKRGRLIQDRLVREKLERDLELARKIQQSSFPGSLPEMRVFDIAAWNEPCDSTGGDVYDVIAREAASGEDDSKSVVLLMADATGHGVGPAISVTQLRSMLRMAVRLGADIQQIAQHTNQQLCDDLPGGRFITAWFGELNDERSTLTILSAGQAPLLYYDAEADHLDVIDAHAVPLGVLSDAEMVAPPAIVMKPGDFFAVISDGIFEARNHASKQYGLDRVVQCLKDTKNESSQQTIELLRQAHDRFTSNTPAEDDRTAIIIKRRRE